MKSRSFLILHGLANDRPPGHWQFLLAAHLTAREHQVLYPALPSPNAPMYVTWKAELHEQLAQMRGGERVVICHSLACLLWLRAAPGLGDHERVDRLLLVSPPTSARVPEAGSSFRLEQGPDVAAVAASAAEIRVACSDDDPYNPGGAQRCAAAFGAEVDIIPGAGHITVDDGYGAWPAVEAWCLEPETRLVANR
jgi:predicted alpha/beta hydrolase family esterase